MKKMNIRQISFIFLSAKCSEVSSLKDVRLLRSVCLDTSLSITAMIIMDTHAMLKIHTENWPMNAEWICVFFSCCQGGYKQPVLVSRWSGRDFLSKVFINIHWLPISTVHSLKQISTYCKIIFTLCSSEIIAQISRFWVCGLHADACLRLLDGKSRCRFKHFAFICELEIWAFVQKYKGCVYIIA